MIFDAHAHIFPDAIAKKAADAIGKFYGYPMACDGKTSSLLREMQEAGIDRALVHSVATTPRQTGSINNFIAAACKAYPETFIGFMAMHQNTEHMVREAERAMSMGLRGVKIHPDIQRCALDDEKFFPLYECIEGRVPLLTHTGDTRYDFSNPDRVLRLLKRYPRLTMICAHLAGYSIWDTAHEKLSGAGVYVDTCSSLFFMTPEKAAEHIRAFGTDKVLFGTDFPMWKATEELERFHALPLTEDEKARILWTNATTLFG